jgi:predicted nucleic acid-binding protein
MRRADATLKISGSRGARSALVAALALRHDVALLTLDGHFEGIEGLRLEALAG